jgi:hypothetical protein
MVEEISLISGLKKALEKSRCLKCLLKKTVDFSGKRERGGIPGRQTARHLAAGM